MAESQFNTPRPNRIIDLSGQTFERWTVIRFHGIVSRNAAWECQCCCGSNAIVQGRHLISGGTKSCGCLRGEICKIKATTHGQAGRASKTVTPEYAAYTTAKSRCHNPKNTRFPCYGGRGIQFCFTSFEQFFAVLGPKPEPEYSLDRINVDGPYEPKNVRWATPLEQRQNKRPRR